MSTKSDRGDRVNQAVLDVLSRKDGSATQAPASPATPAVRTGPKTWIGRIADEQTTGLREQVQRLEAERADGMVAVRLDPKRVRPTEFANRLAIGLTPQDPEFIGLFENIRDNTQLDPIRVRPAPADSGYDYEIVYGHRRHAACLLLDRKTEGGFTVLALIDSAASDPRVLAKSMWFENEIRSDVSAYEKGQSILRVLKEKVFANQTDLAETVRLSQATVAKYVAVATLPSEVLSAFGDPRLLNLRWAPELARVLKQDRPGVLAIAKQIAGRTPRPSPELVLRELLAGPAGAERRSNPTREEAVKIQGKVVFRIARRDGRLTLKFGKLVDKQLQRELAEEVKELAEGLLSKRLKGK